MREFIMNPNNLIIALLIFQAIIVYSLISLMCSIAKRRKDEDAELALEEQNVEDQVIINAIPGSMTHLPNDLGNLIPKSPIAVLAQPKAFRGHYFVKGIPFSTQGYHLYRNAFKARGLKSVDSRYWPDLTDAVEEELIYDRPLTPNDIVKIRTMVQARLHTYHKQDGVEKKYNVYQKYHELKNLISSKEDGVYVD